MKRKGGKLEVLDDIIGIWESEDKGAVTPDLIAYFNHAAA